MWNVFGFLYDGRLDPFGASSGVVCRASVSGFEPDFWYYESWMMLQLVGELEFMMNYAQALTDLQLIFADLPCVPCPSHGLQ